MRNSPSSRLGERAGRLFNIPEDQTTTECRSNAVVAGAGFYVYCYVHPAFVVSVAVFSQIDYSCCFWIQYVQKAMPVADSSFLHRSLSVSVGLSVFLSLCLSRLV